MRVRRFSLIRFREEERGATLAIVAISLIALLGMLVLTFDLGRGVALKRNMVNAADSAALAAARECGLAHGEVKARNAAEELVTDNNDAAGVTGFQLDPAECSGTASDGKNEVTVTVTVPQQYFFAPIFGINNGTVVASATAEWTAGVSNPVPLKLDMLKVEDCTDGHVPGYNGAECYFTFAKSKTGSQRGWLDFPQGWPVQGEDTNPMDCSSQAGGVNDLREYIQQMGLESSSAFQPVLWGPPGGPPPTYVCAAGGVPNDLVQAMQAWLVAVSQMTPKPVVDFPVVACDGQTAPCFPWITTSGHEAYPVVDFVGMRIKNAWSGQAARQQANCKFERKSSDVFCIQLEVAAPGDPSLNGNPRVRLVD
ncbi:MAG TPA: pilus assembly protein TadG-related protein [Actinomycetota bacterium]